MISDPDYHVVCKWEELQLDDGEAQEDVQCLLEVEFDKIQKRYRAWLPDGWLPEECFYWIVGMADGHLGFTSFVLRFIGDKEYSDPDSQLKVCMKFLLSGVLSGINPLHTLDLLYCQILLDIPANDLPATMCILGYLIYTLLLVSVNEIVEFLDIDPGKFHCLFEWLHSVLHVPLTDAVDTHISFYHSSFSKFLRDPIHSSRFWVDEEVVTHDIPFQFLHLLEDHGKVFT
ncbi:hypothetical protein P691DRAFT_762775 [Macrolepiota fuliginosa MF-IS2]|uniref:Uncharacterized protein n=1 Tax=Macrolepiota fuliginosa MF-IS2 TaxID=1400762 RepID=A0A9P6C111_9AGAR|nr:hypothetical protein P691DRAFT_762775 [Macrolepiota fuliginosa MF-IS2]